MHSHLEALTTLFESAPRFVGRLQATEAASWAELLDQAEQIALAMPEDEQIELLDAHPRIGADPATVSALSYGEQGYDRDAGNAELHARLNWLNDEYEQRFGFRFVVFVAGRSRSEIADLIETRLGQARESEKRRGLRDVVAIARSRLAKLAVAPEEGR
jgi:2-oxo-4-hydroxy-4-carboxy--5-ureidoimidazoline (OHCU) decarboxylase